MLIAPMAIAQQLVDPIPEVIEKAGREVYLQPIAKGLTAPNWGTHAPGDRDRLFVTDQPGILWAIDLKTGDVTEFADLSDLLVPLGIRGPDSFDERGLLGVAFHPDYQENGRLYTYTSEPSTSGVADFRAPVGEDVPNHLSVITEWLVPNPTEATSVVDPASRRVLLRIEQPNLNHDGGTVAFGPDGYLIHSAR